MNDFLKFNPKFLISYTYCFNLRGYKSNKVAEQIFALILPSNKGVNGIILFSKIFSDLEVNFKFIINLDHLNPSQESLLLRTFRWGSPAWLPAAVWLTWNSVEYLWLMVCSWQVWQAVRGPQHYYFSVIRLFLSKFCWITKNSGMLTAKNSNFMWGFSWNMYILPMEKNKNQIEDFIVSNNGVLREAIRADCREF